MAFGRILYFVQGRTSVFVVASHGCDSENGIAAGLLRVRRGELAEPQFRMAAGRQKMAGAARCHQVHVPDWPVSPAKPLRWYTSAHCARGFPGRC
jgi:hypothetical protein